MTLVIDRLLAIRALEHFLELTQADRRDRSIEPFVDDLETTMASGLRKQSNEFRRGMRGLKSKWADDAALYITDWLPYLQEAQDATKGSMLDGLTDNILNSLVEGAGHLVDDVGMPMSVSFGLNDPLAVDYAVAHAGSQLKKIDQSTIEGVNRIITTGIQEGQSYSRVMANLQSAYSFSKERARNIAVFETGDAYEGGRRKAVDDMRSQGLQMVKSWLSVGDSLVRPEHRTNQADKWIDVDEPFSGDGAMRPPTDPRCRCTTLYKRGTPTPKRAELLSPSPESTYVVTCDACGATYKCSGLKEYDRVLGTGHGKCLAKPKGKWSTGVDGSSVVEVKPIVAGPIPTTTPEKPWSRLSPAERRARNVLAESWQRSGSYFPLGLRAGLPDIVPWFESTGFPIKISDPSVEETREEGEED